MSTTTKTAANDWSLKARGTASATILAAGGLAAAASVGELAHINPVWGAGVAAVGGLADLVVGVFHHARTASATLYRLICCAGAGSWATWALFGDHNVFSKAGAVSLATGALAAGIAAPFANKVRDTTRPSRALILRSAAKAGDEWGDRIYRVCRVRVKVTNVITWPSGAGYDVHAELPAGGVTRHQIGERVDSLASDARLPIGCGVQVDSGQHRGEIILRVATVNRLAERIVYPNVYTARSILQPLTIGEYADSSLVEVLLRQLKLLISGPTGKGKTTFLQILTAALLRCPDNLTWHLDLNGGGLSQPWIDVWIDGRMQRCPIDWAAPNLSEAKRALRAAIAIAKHRKTAYRKLKRQHNQSLLPISPELPQITIIIDEGAEAVKDRDIERLAGELQNIGRDSAVNVEFSSLRPTSDLVPVNMRKQTGVRIQTHGPDEDELGHAHGWSRRLSMDDLAGTGTGFISIDGAPPRPFRWYDITPAQIEEVALATADIMPTLDEASAEAAGPDYATRYDRMRQFFAEDVEFVDEEETVTPPPAFGRPELSVVNGGGSDGWGVIDDIIARRRGTTVDTPSAVAGFGPAGALTRAPVQAVPELLRQALDAFDSAGVERMHSETLAQALGIDSVNELARLLVQLEVRTLAEAFLVSGKRARGYARETLAEAAEKVALGQIDVPDAVAEWPAA